MLCNIETASWKILMEILTMKLIFFFFNLRGISIVNLLRTLLKTLYIKNINLNISAYI